MIIPKRFSIRHKILELLCEKLPIVEKLPGHIHDINVLNVTCNSISERLQISNQKIHDLTSLMLKEDELEFDLSKNVEVLRVKHNGIVAYIDRKYLVNGRNFVLDTLSKYFYIISGIVLLIIALFTFIINLLETRENRNDIKKLEKRIQQIELKKN